MLCTLDASFAPKLNISVTVRPMAIFFLFVLGVLGSVWGWVWARLVWSPHFSAPLFYFLSGVLVVSFVLQFLRFTQRELFKRIPPLDLAANFFFGLMILLFFGVLIKDASLALTSAAGIPASIMQEKVAAALVLLLSLSGYYWGVRTALAGPRIREIKVPISKWPAGQKPLRIVQISDLHVGSYIKESYVAEVAHRVRALQPDLIAITGDLGDGNVFELQKDLEPLRDLPATYGRFYVSGNHEYYWHVGSWVAKMKDLGYTVLENSGEWIEEAKLWVGGVPDITAHRMVPGQVSDPKKALPSKGTGQGAPKMLLAHQPKSVFGAEEAGFDLMLCGHTHAGQFFPANLIVRFFNPYHHGLYRHKSKLWVYVSAGTGYWGSPLRLFVPAELTVLNLVPAEA